MQLIKRSVAKQKNLKKYFTGKPCVNGHVSERQVSSRDCCECHRLRSLTQSREYKKQYRQEKKSQLKQKFRIYYEKKKPEFRARVAKRRAAREQRSVKWADLDKIKEFYRNCPRGYHVDHVIPLQGKNVSGLHVIENLQYLPAKYNVSKGNKFNVEF